MKQQPNLERLTDRYLDGSIAAAEMEILNEGLSADVDARRKFVELLNLDSALGAAAAGWGSEPDGPARAIEMPRSFFVERAPTRWLVVAASIALLSQRFRSGHRP